MEISTRQLLAPRPAVPIVPPKDKRDEEEIRDLGERFAFATLSWCLLSKARTIKEARWAFEYVRSQLHDPRKQFEPRPSGGRLYAAVSDAWHRMDRLHAKQAVRKAVKANSAIADVTH